MSDPGGGRRIDDGAEFAVHAWQDDLGFEAQDYAANDPQNTKYVAYYREMGMSAEKARAFYAMTNSVPHQQALWLDAADMRGWLANEGPAPAEESTVQNDAGAEQNGAPRIAYAPLGILDLGTALN